MLITLSKDGLAFSQSISQPNVGLRFEAEKHLAQVLGFLESGTLLGHGRGSDRELAGINQCLKSLQRESCEELFWPEYLALGGGLLTHPYLAELGQVILQSVADSGSKWAKQAQHQLKVLSGQGGSFSEHLALQLKSLSHWQTALPVAGGIFAGGLVGRLAGIGSLVKLGRSGLGHILGGGGLRFASSGVAFLGEGVTFSLADRGVRTAIGLSTSWQAADVWQGMGHGLVTMGAFRLSHGLGQGLWKLVHGVERGVKATRWVGMAQQNYRATMLASEFGGALGSGYGQGEDGQRLSYHLAGAFGMMTHFRMAKGVLHSALPKLQALHQALVQKTYDVAQNSLARFGKDMGHRWGQTFSHGRFLGSQTSLATTAASLAGMTPMEMATSPKINPNAFMVGNVGQGLATSAPLVHQASFRPPRSSLATLTRQRAIAMGRLGNGRKAEAQELGATQLEKINTFYRYLDEAVQTLPQFEANLASYERQRAAGEAIPNSIEPPFFNSLNHARALARGEPFLLKAFENFLNVMSLSPHRFRTLFRHYIQEITADLLAEPVHDHGLLTSTHEQGRRFERRAFYNEGMLGVMERFSSERYHRRPNAQALMDKQNGNSRFQLVSRVQTANHDFYLGGILSDQRGRKYCLGLVSFSEGKQRNVRARLFAKFRSGGTWRAVPFMHRGFLVKGGRELPYTAGTQIDENIEHHLTMMEANPELNHDVKRREVAGFMDIMGEYVQDGEHTDSHIRTMVSRLDQETQVLRPEVFPDLRQLRPEDVADEAQWANIALKLVDWQEPQTVLQHKLAQVSLGTKEGATQLNPDVRAKKLFQDLRNLDDRYPPGFIPDFSRDPLRVYPRHDELLGDKVWVEEYEGQLGETSLVWKLARDSKGRLRILSIKDPAAEVTTFGTAAKVYDFGALTGKNIEYAKELRDLDLNRHIHYLPFGEGDTYVDISPLMDHLKPLRDYRKVTGLGRQVTHGVSISGRRKIFTLPIPAKVTHTTQETIVDLHLPDRLFQQTPASVARVLVPVLTDAQWRHPLGAHLRFNFKSLATLDPQITRAVQGWVRENPQSRVSIQLAGDKVAEFGRA